MKHGIGWCSVLKQTLVFQPADTRVVLLEPRDEYLPEGWVTPRGQLQIDEDARFKVWYRYG